MAVLPGQDPSKNLKQFLSAAESLEEQCTGFGEAELKGFWKLAYTNDVTFVSGGGSSGLAAMPYCSLAAHWQCYQVPTLPPLARDTSAAGSSTPVFYSRVMSCLVLTWRLVLSGQGPRRPDR